MVELWKNDFEEGDFSAWTGTTGSPAIETDPHHNTYSARFNVAVAGPESARKTITSATTQYFRLYIKFAALPANYTRHWFMEVRRAGELVARVAYEQQIGAYYWVLNYLIPSNTYVQSSTETITTETWYCVELKSVVNSAANGEYRVYIDGTERITATGLNTAACSYLDQIYVGSWYSNLPTVADYNIDCVDTDDSTYIGLEGAGGGLSIPVAMHHYSHMTKIHRG